MMFFKDHRHYLMHKSIRPGSNPGDHIVTDISVLKYTPDGTILYKLQFADQFAPQECTLQQLFSRPVPISGTKTNLLQGLKSVIPQDYHVFYDSLAMINNMNLLN